MRVDDFDYALPEELIAQSPVTPRDSSRLLVMPRGGGLLEHKRFSDIVEYMDASDVLVVNDSRVMPARLLGYAGSVKVEVLLLREAGDDVWAALVKPGRKFKPGSVVSFGGGRLTATVLGETDEGERVLRLESEAPVKEAIHELGVMPLPPYIKSGIADPERYQTVYSREEGSAAAPTAGLHFTDRLLATIAGMGVKIVPVTLHVGLGTFRPVRVERVEDHRMHSEFYHISAESAGAINSAKGRVFCVGTTSARTLEAAAKPDGTIKAGSGWTDIFICPGYTFRRVDALVTNFHLPKSTLLMLVSAFAGRDATLAAYRTAISMGYRFYSFGDAMLII